MTAPRSLQLRLGLAVGVLLTLLWVTTATVTAVMLRHEIDEVFDSALEETAQRLLPLAVMDIVDRDEEGVTQHLSANRNHTEHFTYLVTDAQGRILCPCHVSFFDVRTGMPNAGAPAKTPLPHLAWVLMDAAGRVIASRGPGGDVEGAPRDLDGLDVYIARSPEEAT